MDHPWNSLLFVLCCSAFSVLVSGDSNVTISLSQGQQLKGLNTTNAYGVTVYKFLGVRYALPPTGNRRFRPPEPTPDWTGVKDAVTRGSVCPQGTNKGLTEDCLYLNVFTPNLKGSLPVLVWIHGGGFRTGSSFGDGDGANMAPRGIVAVTINYRLGPFGFLSTGDDVMPGNYGMLDQVLALKWVQKYIRAFGGDPNQVTIAGESAGALSVSLQIMSPLSKGLFHRVILESGSALSLTAVERPGNKEKVREGTLRTASRLGCSQASSSGILECLQKIDAIQIMNLTSAVIIPRVETTFGFLPDYPINLLKGGHYNKVDTLHGTNSGEWSNTVVHSKDGVVTSHDFSESVRNTLRSCINVEEMSRMVIEAYIKNETDPNILRTKAVQAVADLHYGAGSMVEENIYVSDPSAKTKHFLYEFDFRPSGESSPAWQGVAHAAERRYVFYPGYRFMSAEESLVGDAVQSMWVNFVKYGDPTPSNSMHTLEKGNNLVKWTEYTKNTPNMLQIDSHNTLVPYPRPFVIPLYEKILEILKSNVQIPIVG